MKNETYMFGQRGEKYGIWNARQKKFQFGICEDTPMLAEARLFQHIGNDARKWRFEIKPLPHDLRDKLCSEPRQPTLMTELIRKDTELKSVKKKLREAEEQIRSLTEASPSAPD